MVIKATDSGSMLQQISTPPSLREMAYASLKEAIIKNVLKPGEIYSEQNLARELGMSKTPVHEALIDLSTIGFVTLLSRRGVRVNTLTTEDIINLYSFRLLLESGIIRSVSDIFNDSHLAQLRSIHKSCLDVDLSKGMIEYIRLERAFHDYLASISQNKYMVCALENVRDLIDWMGMTALMRNERVAEVNHEHEEVLEFMAEKNFQKAALSMEKHIRITLENVLKFKAE